MSKHTPGPWYEITGIIYVDSGDTRHCVATTHDSSQLLAGSNAANACLIAAAPELLSAIKRAMHQLVIQEDPDSAFMQAYRAVQKAEGKE